jgi:hypothetical protein
MARFTGVHQEGLLQAYGLREIACGIGILSSTRPSEWLWARVAGDALDLATLGADMVEPGHDGHDRLLASAVAVAGVTALDVICATQLTAADALTDD